MARFCFLSEVDSEVANYMPMYGSATRGQEDIALLAVNSGDADGYEGETEIKTCVLSH